MKRRALALEAYKKHLDKAAWGRLELFGGLWDIQEGYRARAAEKAGYAIPSIEAAETWYWQGRPILAFAPVRIDADTFVASLGEVAGYLAGKACLERGAAECLHGLDWRTLVDETDLSLAGSDPMAYTQVFCGLAQKHAGGPLEAPMAATVLTLAMRPLVEHAAQAVMSSLEDVLKAGNATHSKPRCCPFCGGGATLAVVGETPSSQGKGRLLYCSACGTAWEFERIRCVHCGTRNQGHLHYFHIEGDEAHRLHTCDECGGYARTVFQEHLVAPLVLEVEDVVMAPLDQVANDPRFGLKEGPGGRGL
ncbi:MAG: formate dehydrogenase accessory protein FdhE [Eggerthellaceae bacterium]|jgi:FdhE protein|nr:formate dehydrogenase accessory protein FdhE [Eggerthellaceae bacterium]MDR2715566.1 formate dehydrogenase accessory protein FdhE [Coriobacteriaceae bacterium]